MVSTQPHIYMKLHVCFSLMAHVKLHHSNDVLFSGLWLCLSLGDQTLKQTACSAT